MSKKLILLLVVMSLALSGAAFAAVENIRVSGDISSQALSRNLQMGGTTVPAIAPLNIDAEDFIFSQIRLRFDADLTENVSAVLRLINERIWSETAVANTDDIDVDLAYVKLDEFMNDDLTLTVGRQEIYFGNGLIIGDAQTNQAAPAGVPLAISDLSLRKSFDAARVDWDLAPWTVTTIYAKAFEGATNLRDDVTVSGVNANYAWNDFNGETELYAFYQQNEAAVEGAAMMAAGGVAGAFQPRENQSKTFTLGGRAQWDPNDNWTIGIEGAYQLGDANMQNMGLANDKHRDAFAGQLITEYRFLNDYDATIKFNYTYLSGNDDIADGDFNAWDPMFEDQSPGEILNILFANTNMMYTKVCGTMMPREDLTLGLSYTWAKLAEKSQAGNATAYSPTFGQASGNTYTINRNQSDLGHEIDTWAIWDYTEDVNFNLVGAWYIPGNYFTEANDGDAYSVRGGVSVEY